MNYKVLYNKKQNVLITIPEYLVVRKGKYIYISSPAAIWHYRPDLILLGDL